MAVDRSRILLPINELYNSTKDAISLRYKYYKCYGNYNTSYTANDAYGDNAIGFWGMPRTPYGFYENSGKIAVRAATWSSPAYPAVYNEPSIPNIGDPVGDKTGERISAGVCGTAFRMRTDQIANKTLGYFELEFIDNPSKTSEEIYSGYSYLIYVYGGYISIIRSDTRYLSGLVKKEFNPLAIDTSKIALGVYADGSTVSLYVDGVAVYQDAYSSHRNNYSESISFDFSLNPSSQSLWSWLSTEDANDYSFETLRGYASINGEVQTPVSISPIDLKYVQLFKYDNNFDTANLETSLGYMAVPCLDIPDPLWQNYIRTAEVIR